MSRALPDYAGALRDALASLEGAERVEATFRRSGPVNGAQSVVTIHSTSTERVTIRAILTSALARCAAVLVSSPIRGYLYLYCFDGDGMRHTLEEVDDDLSVAISFDRLAAREGLHQE